MTGDLHRSMVAALASSADQYDSLADAAELMGDPSGAERLRAEACNCRLEAMELLDDRPH
jgi:hypothetical protein